MSAPNPTEIVALINQTDDLRSTCTICLVVSLLAALPIVVTGLVVKERRRFPSRVTTLFMIKIMLMDIVVLLGSAVDYRIPNDINAMLFPNASQMSSAACVAQALSYQFLIWCIMMYWVVIAFCLFKVVTSDSDVQNFRHIERACYLTVYGCATVFTVIPLILNYSQDSRIFKADNKMLWCWLTAETENVSQPLSSHMSFVPFSQVRNTTSHSNASCPMSGSFLNSKLKLCVCRSYFFTAGCWLRFASALRSAREFCPASVVRLVVHRGFGTTMFDHSL